MAKLTLSQATEGEAIMLPLSPGLCGEWPQSAVVSEFPWCLFCSLVYGSTQAVSSSPLNHEVCY